MSKPTDPVVPVQALRAAPLPSLLGFVLGGALDASPLAAVRVLSQLVALLGRVLAGKGTATAQDAAHASAMAARCGFALDVLASGPPVETSITAEQVARVLSVVAARELDAAREGGWPWTPQIAVGSLQSMVEDPDYCAELAEDANNPDELRAARATKRPEVDHVESAAAELLARLWAEDEIFSHAATAPAFVRAFLARALDAARELRTEPIGLAVDMDRAAMMLDKLAAEKDPDERAGLEAVAETMRRRRDEHLAGKTLADKAAEGDKAAALAARWEAANPSGRAPS